MRNRPGAGVRAGAPDTPVAAAGITCHAGNISFLKFVFQCG